MVPPISDRVSRAPPYSRTSLPVSPTGLSPAMARLSRRFRYQRSKATGLVRVRSPLLAESRLMSFPPATEMFQFAGFASAPYGFRCGYRLRGGLPHSEIPGSTIARISPGLFAACHVLHRLSVPRHPPDALRLRFLRHTQRQVPRELGSQGEPYSQRAPPRKRGSIGAANSSLSEDTLCGSPTQPSGSNPPSGNSPGGRRRSPARSHNSLLHHVPSATPSAPPQSGRRRRQSLPLLLPRPRGRPVGLLVGVLVGAPTTAPHKSRRRPGAAWWR